MQPEHDAPHAPQLALSSARFTQALPQTTFAKGQLHVPPEQVAPVGQIPPQRPQFRASDAVFTQAVPQSICPVGHTQRPDAQAAPVGQTVPHAPQFCRSDCVSTHVAPHITRGDAQDVHTAPTHACPAAQGRLHPPQCEEFAKPATSQPSGSVMLQSP